MTSRRSWLRILLGAYLFPLLLVCCSLSVPPPDLPLCILMFVLAMAGLIVARHESSAWRRIWMGALIFSIVAGVLEIVAGWRLAREHEETLSNLPAQATLQIRRWVPIGTSDSDAQRIMAQHHFTCFSTNTEALCFDYRRANRPLIPTVYEMWRVMLSLDASNKVSGVSVKTGLKGL